jgi:hypothetical protein
MSWEEKIAPRGAEYARAFYETFSFAQKAVCLYSAGISWKGAALYGLAPGVEDATTVLKISQETLLAITPNWIVDGSVRVDVEDGTPPSLALPSDAETGFVIATPPQSPFEPPGVSLLSLACANYPPMSEMRDLLAKRGPNPDAESMYKILLDEAQRGLFLPDWAFDADMTAEANKEEAIHGLQMYAIMVGQHRQGLLWSLTSALNGWLTQRFPDLAHYQGIWNNEWLPRDGLRGWEGIYWAFLQCGLPLTRFGQEFPRWLRDLNQEGLISREALRGWIELGL